VTSLPILEDGKAVAAWQVSEALLASNGKVPKLSLGQQIATWR
jgi:hypothetical protein